MEEPQLQRLRYALRSFYRYLREEDREMRAQGEKAQTKVSWQLIYEAIEHHAAQRGITLRYGNGKDRLRAFAAGDADRKNPGYRKFATPNDDLLDAVIEFVADENTPCVRITREELEAAEFDWDAPVRLRGYLLTKFEPARQIAPTSLEGNYTGHIVDEDDLLVREIVLYKARDDGLFRVTETQDNYMDIDESELSALAPEALLKKRLSRFTYEGWGVLTPEMGLLMFLKETGSGMNRYYQVLASDLTTASDAAMRYFTVLYQDFPFEPRAADDRATDALLEEMRENILTFKREQDG